MKRFLTILAVSVLALVVAGSAMALPYDKNGNLLANISGYQSAGSKWTDDSIKKIYAESMSKDEKSKFNEFYDGLAKIVLDSLKEETK